MRHEVQKQWRRWLNRRNRGAKGYNWEQFNEVLRPLPLAPPRVVQSLL